MKKILISLMTLIVMSFSFHTNAQVASYAKRGVLDLMGSGQIRYSSVEIETIGGLARKDIFEFTIGPTIGFFIIDNLRLGFDPFAFSIGYNTSYNDFLNLTGNDDYFIFGLSTRISADYNIQLQERLFLYLGLGFGCGYYYLDNTDSDVEFEANRINIGPIAGLRFALDRALFDFGFNLLYESVGGDEIDDRHDNIYLLFVLRIGSWFGLI